MLSALALQILGSARRMNGDYFPSGLQYWGYIQCVPWERNVILISSLEREIPYHTVKTTTRMSFKMMSAQRLATKTSQKPWGNSIANRAGWSRVGPMQIWSAYWIWLPCESYVSHRIRVFPNPSTRRDGPAPFVETYWLYIHHFKAKGTGKQSVELVNETANISSKKCTFLP